MEGGTFEVTFRIDNPIDGATAVQPPHNAEWLHSLEISDGKVIFTLDPNTAAEPGDAPRVSYHHQLSGSLQQGRHHPPGAGAVTAAPITEDRTFVFTSNPIATFMKNSIKSCLLAAALFLLGACEESKTELPDAPAPVITADTPAAVPATGGGGHRIPDRRSARRRPTDRLRGCRMAPPARRGSRPATFRPTFTPARSPAPRP
ncbi:MAG: hypothetical protein ACLS37_08235 [Alistipes sp.]